MIEALIKKKGMVYLAAELVGCDPATIYDRAAVDARIAACIKDQRGKVVDKAEMKLFDAMEENQPWAIQMMLRTLGKDRGYFEKQEIDASSKGTLVITEEIVDAENTEQTGSAPNDKTAPGTIAVPSQ